MVVDRPVSDIRPLRSRRWLRLQPRWSSHSSRLQAREWNLYCRRSRTSDASQHEETLQRTQASESNRRYRPYSHTGSREQTLDERLSRCPTGCRRSARHFVQSGGAFCWTSVGLGRSHASMSCVDHQLRTDAWRSQNQRPSLSMTRQRSACLGQLSIICTDPGCNPSLQARPAVPIA